MELHTAVLQLITFYNIIYESRYNQPNTTNNIMYGRKINVKAGKGSCGERGGCGCGKKK